MCESESWKNKLPFVTVKFSKYWEGDIVQSDPDMSKQLPPTPAYTKQTKSPQIHMKLKKNKIWNITEKVWEYEATVLDSKHYSRYLDIN